MFRLYQGVLIFDRLQVSLQTAGQLRTVKRSQGWMVSVKTTRGLLWGEKISRQISFFLYWIVWLKLPAQRLRQGPAV